MKSSCVTRPHVLCPVSEDQQPNGPTQKSSLSVKGGSMNINVPQETETSQLFENF